MRLIPGLLLAVVVMNVWAASDSSTTEQNFLMRLVMNVWAASDSSTTEQNFLMRLNMNGAAQLIQPATPTASRWKPSNSFSFAMT